MGICPRRKQEMIMKSQITIDLRMYRMSGIGRYLQNLMPDLIPRLDVQRIRLLGNTAELANECWANDSRIELREFRTSIFSVAEQLPRLRSPYRDTGLLWVPQYNIPLLYRGKLLVTIHDVCQLAYPEVLANGLQRRYARHLLSAVATRAEAVICVSEFTASEVHKYLGVDRSRITVTHPPVITFPAVSDNSQSGPNDPPYLLAVGNIKKHKNIKRLIAAFERVQHQIPHRLIVVGKQDGFLNSETDLGSVSTLLKGRVHFTGHVSEQELARYYRHAESLIFPSIYEGFGFPLVEAMAQGCPVACSNTSSLPEVAGDAALLFNPFSEEDIARALLTIAIDRNLRAMLIGRGLKRVESFRGGGCAEKTSAVINNLLSSSSVMTRP